jgi:hypothetical protein
MLPEENRLRCNIVMFNLIILAFFTAGAGLITMQWGYAVIVVWLGLIMRSFMKRFRW